MAGGLSVPRHYQYYISSLLDQSKYGCTNDTNKTSPLLEAKSLLIPSTRDILMATLAGYKPLESLFPSVQATIQAIWACTRALRLGNIVSTLPFPVHCLQIYIPHLNLSSWVKVGIHHVKDLLENNSIHPFNVLQQKYNLPSTEYYNMIHTTIPSP